MAASDVLGARDAAHLLRRAGFGADPGEVARFSRLTRARAVAQLLRASPSRARGPGSARNRLQDLESLQRWWLRRMQGPTHRLHEKLALFWHDHFPTSFAVVTDLPALAEQNRLFRQYGLGSFRELVYQVTVDPAMLDFLNGAQNRRGSPNENYARELMELFTLGPLDRNGIANYTQDDVVELARALTGFTVTRRGARREVQLEAWAFDGGSKRLFAAQPFEAAGNLGVQYPDGAQFPPERNVIDLLFAHRDSDGRPTLARFIARKLFEWFAYPAPAVALLDELADVFAQNGYRIADLVEAILVHDAFYADEARESTAKTPVDFALQALEALEAQSRMQELPGQLREMGMELFIPPGVEGWNHGEAWLSTSGYLARIEFAQALAGSRRGAREYRIHPERLLPRGADSDPEIVDALLARLQLNVPPATRQSLVDYLTGGSALPQEDWVEVKLRGLLVLLLSLPEFQVH